MNTSTTSTVSILNIIENSPFWSSLSSGLIITIFAAFLLPFSISYFRKPKKIELFLKESGKNSIYLSKNGNNDLNYDFELVFRHLSGETLNHEIYWHLYIPKFTNPIPLSLGPNSLPTQKDEKNKDEIFTHFSGKMPGPIFTGTTHWFHYKFSGSFKSDVEQIKNNNRVTLYYFLSTEYGNFPKNLKQNLQTGEIDIETTNKLFLNIP